LCDKPREREREKESSGLRTRFIHLASHELNCVFGGKRSAFEYHLMTHSLRSHCHRSCPKMTVDDDTVVIAICSETLTTYEQLLCE